MVEAFICTSSVWTLLLSANNIMENASIARRLYIWRKVIKSLSNSQIFQNALLDYLCTLNPKLFPRETEIFTVSFPEVLIYKSLLFHTPVPPPSGLILLPSKIMYIPTKMKIITKEEKLKFYFFQEHLFTVSSTLLLNVRSNFFDRNLLWVYTKLWIF